MSSTVSLRPVRGEDDRDYVETVLETAGLPTTDLDADAVRLFVCERAGDRVGTAGVEHHGEYALVRSIAVEASARGNGYGSAICDRLLERARDAGAAEAYLLTTTAAEFFGARGFDVVARDAVPGPIRETTQFGDVCPSSATCMRRDLD